MKLLILGGTHFAGRAIVEAAVAAGDEVTTLNRGRSRTAAADVRTLTADRTNPDEMRAALADGEWDAVIDTWTWPASAAATSADLLKDRVGHYNYVSTVSVCADPLPTPVDEQATTVPADPDSDDTTDYQAAKRGCELAILRAFGADRTLLGRPGLILGPYENIGRLPWWLRRIERGGRVLAPGAPDRTVQFIDVRDLAVWMLRAAHDGTTGVYNLDGPPTHTTMGALLDDAIAVTGSDAELVWVPDKVVRDAGISPWTELPIYLPDDPEWAMTIDASKAGLTVRPAAETVADTWAWLRAEGDPPGRPGHGLDPAKEDAVLAALA